MAETRNTGHRQVAIHQIDDYKKRLAHELTSVKQCLIERDFSSAVEHTNKAADNAARLAYWTTQAIA